MSSKLPLLLALLGAAGCPGETVQRPRSDRGATDVPGVRPEAGSVDVLPWLIDTGPLGADLEPKLDSKPAPKPDTKPPADAWSGPNDIGKPCTKNSDCQYNLCAQNTHTGTLFCTKVCDRCDPQPCPTGSGCQNAGLAYICAPGYPNAPCP